MTPGRRAKGLRISMLKILRMNRARQPNSRNRPASSKNAFKQLEEAEKPVARKKEKKTKNSKLEQERSAMAGVSVFKFRMANAGPTKIGTRRPVPTGLVREWSDDGAKKALAVVRELGKSSGITKQASSRSHAANGIQSPPPHPLSRQQRHTHIRTEERRHWGILSCSKTQLWLVAFPQRNFAECLTALNKTCCKISTGGRCRPLSGAIPTPQRRIKGGEVGAWSARLPGSELAPRDGRECDFAWYHRLHHLSGVKAE